MKVYIVNRKDIADWGETTRSVVLADSESQAISIAFWSCYDCTMDNLYAEEVDLNSKPRVIASET